jgi:hypothetical protein
MSEICCPSCKKQIEEFARSKTAVFSFPFDPEADPLSEFYPGEGISGFVCGNIIIKKGKCYLALEALIECPYCKKTFCLEFWLPTLETQTKTVCPIKER